MRHEFFEPRPRGLGAEVFVYPDRRGWSVFVSTDGGGYQALECRPKPECIRAALALVDRGAELAVVNTPWEMFGHSGLAGAFTS